MTAPRTHFRRGLSDLYNWLDLNVKPTSLIGFRADLGGFNQAGIPDSEPTKVNFTHEVFDAGSKYDAINAKWTPGAGLARISAQILGSGDLASPGGVIQAIVYKNGEPLGIGETRAVAEGINTCAPVSIVDLAVDEDYYELFTLAILVADTATVIGLGTRSYFSGVLTAA